MEDRGQMTTRERESRVGYPVRLHPAGTCFNCKGLYMEYKHMHRSVEVLCTRMGREIRVKRRVS